MTFVRSTFDLTDDGVADVLLVSTTPGATTQTEDVRVYTWDDGTPRRVFDVAVGVWVRSGGVGAARCDLAGRDRDGVPSAGAL